MAIELISKIKQKNNGQFFLVDAKDVEHVYTDAEGNQQTTSVEEYLNGINKITVDDVLKVDSVNPVQNKIVKAAIDAVNARISSDSSETVADVVDKAIQGIDDITVNNIAADENKNITLKKDNIGIFTAADEPSNASDGDIWIDTDEEYTFPTSLPADGGNSDTVDGKHASDFASASDLATVQASIKTLNDNKVTVDASLKTTGAAADAKATGDAIAAVGNRIGSNGETVSDVVSAAITGLKLDETYSKSGHTHTKSEITDFPASLPANGGNADTVDNKHASDFADATEFATVKDYVGGKSVAEQISEAMSGFEISDPYIHPTYTERASGLYKITVDNTGHVSDAITAIKDDIGIFTSDTEPTNAQVGDIWVDTSADSEPKTAAPTIIREW